MPDDVSQNLYEIFHARFRNHLQNLFLRTPGGKTYTYDDVHAISAQYANTLATRGLKVGDRVAVQVEKSPESVFLYLACLRVGAVFLPLNTAYQTDELEYFLSDAEPTIVVGEPNAQSLADLCTALKVPHHLTLGADGSGTLPDESKNARSEYSPPHLAGSDLAAILYSSGTTGRPKGVMLTHANLAANAQALHKIWGFGPDDVLLHALPIFHTHGLFVALNTVLFNGTGMLFHSKFDTCAVINDLPNATIFMGVPTYYVRLLADEKFTREVCNNVRLFLSGSAPLLDETFRAFKRRTEKQLVERYGMTEAGIITSAKVDRPRTAGDVGWPLPNVTLRIADNNDIALPPGETGEVQIKGPGVFKGYWRKPDKTEEDFTSDGFFKTGDLALTNDAGMVSIVGRAKDMMISGGFNVYPKEIEAIIDGLPGIEESAVVGMPHPDFGEAGLAVVTVDEESSAPNPQSVRKALKDELANFKVPKLVVIAKELPRNAMGKVQKAVLRQTYSEMWANFIGRQRL